MSETLAAWLYTHPRVRRVWLMFQLIWGGSLLAVVTAPRAAADSVAAGLSFTGLHDSYGVPIGSLFVSVLPLGEVIGAQGAQFGVSPDTWGPALVSALATTATYTQLAGWLGLECAFFLTVCAIGIWLIKFALGAIWLGWLAAVASPFVANIQGIVNRLHLIEGGMLAATVVGGITCFTVGYGAGMGVIGGSLVVAVLTWMLLRDPVGELVSDNGVLGIGRSLGFTVSQGIAHNGPIAAGGTSSQLDTLTSWLCDVLVRDVIQLISFGQVIDDIGGCAAAFNTAILSGVTERPAQAMKTCGATAAYAHAQQLSAISAGLFFVVICLVMLILAALDYIGCEAFRIGFKAFWDVLVIVPAAALAMFPGPPRRHAKKRAVLMLVHGAEMLAATAGLGILVLLMAQATRGSLPGATGMTSPLAKLLVMLLIAGFGAPAFRYALRLFGDGGIPGPWRMARAAHGTTMRGVRAVEDVKQAGRTLQPLSDRIRSGTGSSAAGGGGDQASAHVNAPGRKAHPPAAGSRPPNKASGGPGSQPGPAGPGRSAGGSHGATPAVPVAAGASAPAAAAAAGRGGGGHQSPAGEAARKAAVAVAPEVAVPAEAARRAATALRRHGQASSGASKAEAPGRSGPRPTAEPATRGNGSATTPPGRTQPKPGGSSE
ncbi:hypothetical protein [[Mycobacterium] nativiensis]|uniref:TrbL/VirB6 plasmid conjugal transfer protein n=1 Tax=[Mycobacterium] nativiensis TaxID=2855503 RepID=A0ABU5XV18_9MYCO|nr:hypothetical protein [Mycolicibacter sp. MYC340]MEB3031780.1 hypothetical protein [Mycolicibacter sp. MYC340]